MDKTRLPTRLIICADGTWFSPDGAHGRNHSNISNVYRICASVKVGECRDSHGRIFNQQKEYIHGIGSKDDVAPLGRLKIGIFGDECFKQIRDIYEKCCMLDGPDDEVWFYGFSRGAFVVRAVAGLLHYLRALASAGTPAFDADYSQALKVYKSMQKSSHLGPGQIHDFFSATTRPSPKIQFIGAFDTVKAVNDRSLYDISFNDSTQHLRHALALNEDRNSFSPEELYPEFNRNQLRERSFIQAWFLGAHLDMGGSAAKDGLSLYPLQWMLLESRSKGLVCEFDGSFGSRAKIDNPYHVVFPKRDTQEKQTDMWSCKVENGIQVQMQDLRKVHESQIYHGNYGIHLNKRSAIYFSKGAREPFGADGELQGYCGFAPQGTILHPSVYLIFDEYCHVLLDSKELGYRKHIEAWRSKILPPNSEFWNDRQITELNHIQAIRVLVCGNTGVGKSSLINEVFGVHVTESSERKRGVHNVNEPFTTPDRPDLLIHDSGGFEAGGVDEMQDIQQFVTERSAKTDVKDRLHLIWFCLELNSDRIQQSATIKLFSIVSQYARNVPIIIVLTKKDQFMGVKMMEARNKISMEGMGMAEYFAAMDKYAELEYHERVEIVEKELLEIKGGRFDASVGVSKDDKKSIDLLTETTARCFDDEKVRLCYIAAQVTRIDLKVDLAIAETMRIYRHTARSALASGFIPGGASTTKFTVSAVVCKAITACFGIPKVSAKTIQEIVFSVIWEDIGHNAAIFFSEGVAVAGILFYFVGGPAIAGVVNAPIVVPATTRLFLMLAADVILILAMAFKDSTDKCIGQPLKKDIEAAAQRYRKVSKTIHKRVKKIVPRTNMIKSFQMNRVSREFEEILNEYKNLVTEGIGQSIYNPRNSYESANKKVENGEDSDSDCTVVDFNL